MRIIIDAMGGDLAPEQIVLGAVDALAKDSSLEPVLVGDESAIKEVLASNGCKTDGIEIVNATEVITNDESPTVAIKTKKDSSLVKAFDRLMSDDSAMALVSAGSTGAVLTGSVLKVRRIKGVSRPALAPVLPTLGEHGVVLCDCGANVDCKPLYLVHFAIMASSYAEVMLGVKDPRVGLLNNGAEEHKGNALTKQAFELLKNSDTIHFVGNCEARDILSGNFDVVISDGFNGNIALKTAEGTAETMLKLIKSGVYSGGLKSKLGALMLKGVFSEVKHKLDYNSNGGACFLGVNKVIVKSHGSSKRKSICASILQAMELAKRNICAKISGDIEAYVLTHPDTSNAEA